MKVLDFYADYTRWEDSVWYRKEATLRLPTSWDKLFYCKIRSGSRRGEYRYEYFLLKEKKSPAMQFFFPSLVGGLDKFTVEEQYYLLRRMENIKLDFDMTEEMRKATWSPHPLISVRGTCGQEETCRKDHECKRIYFENCCTDKKVGFTKVALIRNPQYYAFLTDLVIWKAWCPDLDVLFVMHDNPSDKQKRGRMNFRYAFMIRGNRITYIKEAEEVERLYHIYNKEYPCDTGRDDEVSDSIS